MFNLKKNKDKEKEEPLKSGEPLEIPDPINKKRKPAFFNIFNKDKKYSVKEKSKFLKNKEPLLQNVYLKKKKQKREYNIHKWKKRQIFYLEKAGLDIEPEKISKRLYYTAFIITSIITIYFLYNFYANPGYTLKKGILIMSLLWTTVFATLIILVRVFFYFSVDMKIFNRNKQIEDVLPDFLQLTASNIKAGMTIDRALWYAVRPRFGVLAKEIEIVAKETMSGKDLKDALKEFVSKFNSRVLKRSISLLIEGMDSGGEIGDLLIRISSNIQETKIMKQEMAANVTTYVIFISFATIMAAPFLFALSGVLIKVIQSISTTMGSTSSAASSSFAISFKGAGVSHSDFVIFAVLTLIISSFFSAAIIATITKGDIKSGIKYIPLFIIVSLAIYFVGQIILNSALGTFF